jgi:CDP-paratose 2-epimerase
VKILLSGICGFVGAAVAQCLQDSLPSATILGFDNFSRPGSELNRDVLRSRGIKVWAADARSQSDMDALPPVDWVVDASALPSVLAGLSGSSTRQLLENNLSSTINLLEVSKKNKAGFILLSTSRVYSIPAMCALPLVRNGLRYDVETGRPLPVGFSAAGLTEEFSTAAPVSLYGATKLASEVLAQDYAHAFGFPLIINRCGVMAGPGQFGKADQGIFSYWIHRWNRHLPLKYIGFQGTGAQVRDCLAPEDLADLLVKQIQQPPTPSEGVFNVSGGLENSFSLAQLSAWCTEHLGPHAVEATQEERPYDLAWVVLDASKARARWDWSPRTPLPELLQKIAAHARMNPRWMEACEAL